MRLQIFIFKAEGAKHDIKHYKYVMDLMTQCIDLKHEISLEILTVTGRDEIIEKGENYVSTLASPKKWISYFKILNFHSYTMEFDEIKQ